MEDIILHTLDDTKVRFDLEALIRIGIVLALVIATSVALSIPHRRLKAKPETAAYLSHQLSSEDFIAASPRFLYSFFGSPPGFFFIRKKKLNNLAISLDVCYTGFIMRINNDLLSFY